jgi:isopenicillin-N N-acyltransferase-like protein
MQIRCFANGYQDVIVVYEVRSSGSYYDIGLKIGKVLEKDKGLLPKFSKEKLEKAKEYEEVVRTYTPELLEELRGIADGSGVDYDVVAAHELSPYRLQPSCLVMAVSGDHTKGGLPVLARNHEWIEEDSKYLTLCYTKPRGKMYSLGFTFHWANMSRYGGINEAGLAISSASASFVNSGPGLMFNVAQRWILDNCRTIEEATNFLERIPKTWGTAYMIIDRNGSIAKVEAHREKTKTTYSDKGFEFVSLRFDSPEMEKYNEHDKRGEWAFDTYSARKPFLEKWFLQNKGNIHDEMIMDVLKNHENKMCTHDYDGKVHYGICWSWILLPGKNEAAVCIGPPCKGQFRKIRYLEPSNG